MAIYRSNLFTQYPYHSSSVIYEPKFAWPDTQGRTVVDIVTIPITANLANLDTCIVTPVVPVGTRCVQLSWVCSVALDSSTGLTVKAGWTSSTSTLVASAANWRDTTAVSVAESVILAAVASAAGDNLLFSITANPTTGATGTVTVRYALLLP